LREFRKSMKAVLHSVDRFDRARKAVRDEQRSLEDAEARKVAAAASTLALSGTATSTTATSNGMAQDDDDDGDIFA
jgi:hypothetical protein